jgi:hypothetical protein
MPYPISSEILWRMILTVRMADWGRRWFRCDFFPFQGKMFPYILMDCSAYSNIFHGFELDVKNFGPK